MTRCLTRQIKSQILPSATSSDHKLILYITSTDTKIMNGDPALEPQLDLFSLILPLPFRVALTVVLGIWAWGLNLHYLSTNKINVISLIHPRSSPRIQASSYLSTYRLATVLSGILLIFILIFWTLCHFDSSLVLYYDIIPVTYLCLLIGIFFLPTKSLCPAGRFEFLATFRRILICGLAQSKEEKFADILLADVLTSYAKIIADLFVVFCMFFRASPSSANARPDRTCGGHYWVPMIISMPSLIRLRQCFIEFFRIRSAGGPGWGGQHLANALKYSSAFPVIIFSYLQRSTNISHKKDSFTEQNIHYCWVLSMLFNSLYSFYWDVAKDWDIAFFPALIRLLPFASTSMQLHLTHTSKKYQFALRPRLYFSSPALYYVAIFFDLIIRFSWTLKLSPFLDHFTELENYILTFELAEITRRWVWIFLRIETEWIRQNEGTNEVEINNLLSGEYDFD